MIKLSGKPVFGGIIKGKIIFYNRDETVVKKEEVENPELELIKFEYAKHAAISELSELYETAIRDVGQDDASIFTIHQMIINDIDFNNSVENLIKNQHLNADYAIAKTANEFSKNISCSNSDYIKERTIDVKDVCDRLIRHIQKREEDDFTILGKAIICADDLVPSETIKLDKSKVLALCTRFGSGNSHTAILARSMNIPVIMGLGKGLSDRYNGFDAIVDGYSGDIFIEPDQVTCNRLDKKEVSKLKKRELLKRLKGMKNIILDGKKTEIYANIGQVAEIDQVIENDAGGIGLFRSEFLYLDKDKFPSEDLQFINYKNALERMNGKEVVIRTIDIGADKNAEYFNIGKEQNPALGLRSIRLCFERPEVFKTQLRALLRASVYGKLSIMFPMITDISEVRLAKQMIEEVKDDLHRNSLPYSDDILVGAMIETPAAVVLSDILAKELDFFSIGTNDLEQYTLAFDRNNESLEKYYPKHHLALMRMIKLVCDNAHKHGIPVGICGELASDLDYTQTFLQLDIDYFSVAPQNVLPLRKKIRTIDLSKSEPAFSKNHV